MEYIVPALIVAGFVLFVGVIAYANWQAELERTAALQEEVTRLGLQFRPLGDVDLQLRFSRLRLFQTGSQRKMTNLMLGESADLRVAIFDYVYSTGGGKNRRTHRQTVVAVESDKLQIPPFEIRPENLTDRIGSLLGFQDLDLDEHPEFSRAFVLKTPDEPAVRKFLDWPMLDFFVRHPTMCLETKTGMFIYFVRGRRILPLNLRKELEFGYTIYHLLLKGKSGPSTGKSGP